MIVGIPRERKTLEKRVAITPDGARTLRSLGHRILVERDAGLGSHFTNEQFEKSGCELVNSLEEVWTKAELLLKVKEPAPEEYRYFRPGLVLFDYLHLASMPELAERLRASKVTAIGYELVQTADGRLPLLEPMSEVAGKLSVLNGGYFLLSQNGGRGVLLGGTVGVPPAKVVIIGAGIAGQCACEVASGAGADVTVLDISYRKLEHLRDRFGSRIKTLFSTPASLERELSDADLVIGAVLVPGASAPKIVTREMVAHMQQGSVIVDISIDQGGCVETMRPTNLDAPVFVVDGVIHYGVCNMPAQTPRTSTIALTSATLPYVIQLAGAGVDKSLRTNAGLRAALNVYQGEITNQAVASSLGLPFGGLPF